MDVGLPSLSSSVANVELIHNLMPLGLMHVQEILDEEVTALAGARERSADRGIAGTGASQDAFSWPCENNAAKSEASTGLLFRYP